MQQHNTKCIQGTPCPSRYAVSAFRHKERAMHDVTSPFTFKEDNKDWHSNLTSSFGLWNCYKWSQKERRRTIAVRAPLKQFLNIPHSKLLIQFVLHSSTSSLKENGFFTIGPAHRTSIRTRHNFFSVPGKTNENSHMQENIITSTAIGVTCPRTVN